MLGQHVHDFDLSFLDGHAPDAVPRALPPGLADHFLAVLGHVEELALMGVPHFLPSLGTGALLGSASHGIEPVGDILASVLDEGVALLVWRGGWMGEGGYC